MNSRWIEGRLAVLLLLIACGKKEKAAEPPKPPADPATAEAQQLGLELREVVDRVMAYRSSHRNQLPTSLRQAGIDSLTSDFIRRLGREGAAPLVTIAFRRVDGRILRSCDGTSQVLEDAMLRDGSFEITCATIAGGSRTFTVEPPPPPPPPQQ